MPNKPKKECPNQACIFLGIAPPRHSSGRLIYHLRTGLKRFRWWIAPPRIRDPFPALGTEWVTRFLPERIAHTDLRDRRWLLWIERETRERIVEAAETNGRGIFDVLGSGAKELGLSPDWHADFGSQTAWPSAIASRKVARFTQPGADIKRPQELSRFNWLPGLALAWRITLREDLAIAARTLLLDWIEKNPPARGVNWTCAMNAGIRSVNWVWSLALLQNAPGFDKETSRKILTSLWTHGHFIRHHLEYPPESSLHRFLGGVAGLFHIGLLFRGSRRGRRWLEHAWQELYSEMGKQVAPDGSNIEASIAYHRLALEFFAICALLAKGNGMDMAGPFAKRLRAMFEFVKGYIRPDGTVPQIGDNDSGRCFYLDPRSVADHRYLLSWGGLLFDDPSLKVRDIPASPETILFFGPEATKKWNLWTIQYDDTSGHHSHFGLATLADFPKGHMLSCFSGPIGQFGRGGHAHNDKLSLELVVAGRPILVDPGTGCFGHRPEWKQRFRSTASHSTLQIGDLEQAPFAADGSFRLDGNPKAHIVEFRVDTRGGRIVGEHFGWTRFDPPWVHRREIDWNRTEGCWTVRDRLLPDETTAVGPRGQPCPPTAQIHWVLHPNVTIRIASDGTALLVNKSIRVSLRTRPQCHWEMLPWWFSPEYGIWFETSKIVFHPDIETLVRGGIETLLRIELPRTDRSPFPGDLTAKTTD